MVKSSKSTKSKIKVSKVKVQKVQEVKVQNQNALPLYQKFNLNLLNFHKFETAITKQKELSNPLNILV